MHIAIINDYLFILIILLGLNFIAQLLYTLKERTLLLLKSDQCDWWDVMPIIVNVANTPRIIATL